MEHRIFQIDRDCILVFTEELSSRKECFLRIGSSPLLIDFKDKLTFKELITPILVGDPLVIADELSNDRPATFMGLKRYITEYVSLLKTFDKDLSKIQVICADEKNKLSEKQFINALDNSSKQSCHTFASFYGDGNIRIFNKEGIFFDLSNELKYHILQEIDEICRKNAVRFDYSDKTGFIISNNSLFIFDDNIFYCISNSDNWVLDAAIVGISPLNIDTVCTSVPPSIGWMDVFHAVWKTGKRIKLVSRSKNMPDSMFLYRVNPSKKTFLNKSGKVIIQYQNNRIKVILDSISLSFDDTKNQLEKGGLIECVVSKNKRIKHTLIVDGYAHGVITIYRFQPFVLSDILPADSVKECYNAFTHIPQQYKTIIKSDTEYPKGYVIPLENRNNLISSVIGESIRRIVCEGGKTGKDITLIYADFLKNVSGKYFRDNAVTIVQFGFIGEKGLELRSVVQQTGEDIYNGKQDVFSKFSTGSAAKIQNLIDELHADSVNQQKELYRKDIIYGKKLFEKYSFYESEYNKFVNFLDELSFLDEKMERAGLPYDASYATLSFQNNFDEEQKPAFEEPIETYSAQELFDNSYTSARLKKRLPIGYILIVVLCILATALASLYFMKNKKTKKITPVNIIKQMDDKAVQKKRTVYYGFSMTKKDRIDITSSIALANGYRRLLFPFEVTKGSYGKDPDWIYPGNVLLMPDDERVVIEEGDVMWKICERYLYKQMSRHEKEIVSSLEDVKKGSSDLEDIRMKLEKIRDESDSEMIRAFIHLLFLQKTVEDWVYIHDKMGDN